MLPRSARTDLRDIIAFNSTDRESAKSALAFTKGIVAYCERLATNPAIVGSLRPEYGRDVRTTSFKGYVILMRYGPSTLKILRIFSGRRDRSAITAEE